ncbi:MAG: amidase [Bryobacteraceae bacterium]|nr:amidase [Bryobacteraceae bacterium]
MTRRQVLAAGSVAAAAPRPADLCFLTARELARRMRKRDLSAREVLAAHLAQIERVNPKVNAVVTLVAEAAARRAAEADQAAAKGRFLGPLHGLPIAHKDLQDTRGIRTTYGSPLFRDHVPDRDTLLIERLRGAGALTLGKTNTPEFGAGSQTFNPVFGATRNPHDLSKTCGGSSGGAAVALACGMIPIADGSDTGGSLRNPAAFCGVVGFRPSPGRVPRVPSGYAWSTISVVGPMARNTADLALMLSAIAGADARDPLSIDERGSRFAQPLERGFKGARVALWKDLGGLPFDPRMSEVVRAQAKALESLGCVVEQAEPDFTGADESFKVFRALSFYSQHAPKVAQHRDKVKATVIEEVERGAALTGPEIAAAETKRSHLYARVGEFMQKYEYFVLPTTQVPAFDVERPFITEINGVRMNSYIDWMRSCYYITMTTLPAISVPAGFTADGLPVGMQIVGRHHADFSVLQLAHAYEQARGELRWPAVAKG